MRKITTLGIAMLCSTFSFIAQAQTVVATGNGQASVKAESIEVEVSILNREKTSEKALKETAGSIGDIAEFIAENKGVSHMSTGTISIEGIWSKLEKGYAYESVQTLTIRIDSIAVYDFVMQNLAKEGVDQISMVAYQIANEEQARAKALKAAVKNAKAKAQAMASELSVSVGTPLEIFENTQENNSADLFMIQGEPTEMSMFPGNLVLSSSVTVTFKLK